MYTCARSADLAQFVAMVTLIVFIHFDSLYILYEKRGERRGSLQRVVELYSEIWLNLNGFSFSDFDCGIPTLCYPQVGM